MSFDPTNLHTLCAEGMQVDDEPAKALAPFEQAWAERRDDFDASVASHSVARLQASAAQTLHWNEVALQHADSPANDRAISLVPSLCLNLADSYLLAARVDLAEEICRRGMVAIEALPQDGYSDFVRCGLTRLLVRIGAARAPKNPAA